MKPTYKFFHQGTDTTTHYIKKTLACLFFFTASLSYTPSLFSQVRFNSLQKNIGTVQANGDILKINYTFKNESTQPMAIARIASSCGCAIPSFDKRPVPAGQQGHITLSFNPVGIEGFFKKRISVYFSGTQQPIHLYLSGKVLPVENLKPGYHYAIGVLQFRNIRTTLKASSGQTTMRTFSLTNSSNQPVTVSLNCHIKEITFEEDEFTLSPGEQKKLVVYFSPQNSGTLHIRIIKGHEEKQKVALKVVPDL